MLAHETYLKFIGDSAIKMEFNVHVLTRTQTDTQANVF